MNTPPGTKALTAPVTGLTDAMDDAELLHNPPEIPSVKIIVRPVHIFAGPEIAVGAALTVIENVW